MSDAEKLGDADGLRERGVLDERDDLVRRRRKDALDHLRQHDAKEGLALREAENLRGLVLPAGNRLDAAAVNLCEIGGIIEDEGDDDRDEAVVGKAEKVIRREIDEDKLQDERRAAHYQKVRVNDVRDDSPAGHAGKRDRQRER